MKIFWKNHKLIFIAVGYLLVVSILIYLLGIPFLNKIKNKTDNIQQRLLDNQLDEAKLNKINDLEEQYAYLENKEGALEVILDSQEEVSFIERLENLATETGNTMKLSVVEQDSSSKTKNTQSVKKKENEKTSVMDSLTYDKYLSFQINLKGDYASFLQFLYRLENSPNYVNIISLEVKKEEVREESNGDTHRFGDIFIAREKSASDTNLTVDSEPKKKETLNSVINIIVYLKK